MKLGMSSAVFYGYLETEDAAAALKDYGLQTCEVFLETHSEYSAAFGQTVRERLRGLPCVSVHPKGTQFEPDIFGQSSRQHRDAMEIFRRVCQAGQALGARWYIFHGVSTVRAQRSPAGLYRLVENLGEMAAIAREYGMEVLWENVSWCALRTPEDVAQVRSLLPEQGFVLDLKQAHQVGCDPFAMIDAMGPRLRHLHMLDWTASGELVLPGEGIMDFPRLFRRLAQMGYTGAAILEPYAIQGRDPQRLRRSLDYLRRQMEEAQA